MKTINQNLLTRRAAMLGGLGLGAAGLLAGCGSGSPSGGSDAGASGSPSASGSSGAGGANAVGVLPIVDVATIYIAMTQGIFADHGLDIETTLAQGGAAIVPAVVSGSSLFGFSNLTSLIIGRSRGLDLVTVAPASGSNGTVGGDYFAVVVGRDSPITDGTGLSGATVAVNTLQNINDTTLRAAVRDAGGDPSGIQYLEVAFPDMPAALDSGQVDAIAVGEPFLTIAKDQGAREVLSSYAQPISDLTVSAYFTSRQAWEAEPETISSFQQAMAEAQAIARSDEAAVRSVLPEYTSLEPDLIERIVLPSFPERINEGSTQALADLAQEDGLLEEPVDLADLLGEGSS
ncbi:ABC transporter substrate-binding protein [Citricoccus sp.]|uniref:ABC transporter substrate-binding protein n=1 Tax=Citricoccus sp. TaxID=1978372 RepID=UPI0028BF2FF8|nr:ABC transporter substrate-binding protein [Citricoccus sp.]